MKVLLVEDHADTRVLQRQLLTSLGHIVVECETTAAAQAAYQNDAYELAVVDLMLPDSDGLELCRSIKGHPRGCLTSILVCTSRDGADALKSSLRAGVDDFLHKPFTPEDFQTRIRFCEQHAVRRAERQEILDSLRVLKENVANCDDAMIGKTLEGIIVAWNPAAERLYGFSASEAIGQHISIIEPDERKEDFILRKLREGAAIRNFETSRRHKDGRVVHVSLSVSPLKNASGEVIGGTVISRDVSDRKAMENALAAAEQRFSRILESNLIPIFIWNLDGTITEANDVFLKLVQYSRSELQEGKVKWSKLTPPEYEELDRRGVEQILRTGTFDPLEKEYIRQDGTRIPVLLAGAAFEPRRDHGIAFVIDLSSRKALEQQLRQAQKMEAIGRLAGGIAHDFNNLLTVILGRIERLLTRVDGPERRDLELIRATGDRAAALTRQLLQFSRQQVLQPKVIKLSSIVADMTEMLRRLIGEHIELVVVDRNSTQPVKADPTQVQQVVLNLVVNARDSIAKGGKITVETSDVDLDEKYARQHLGLRPGSYAMLAVSDTGSGMSEEVKSHLFEPFYTTKEQGKGTGLGLSTVYGIVKQSGGEVLVYSELGYGTTFKIYLPASSLGVSSLASSSQSAAHAVSGETILVVEDEAEIALLIKDVLADSGYRVLFAKSADEALALSKSEPEIDLLLTDVILPKVGGKELALKLRESRPRMKVLFMSGYTTNAIVNHGILDVNTEFLEKPFTPATLSKKIRDVLDSER